jgi:hypothetical protein
MCFTASWFMNLLIYLVIVGAIFAIVRLLIPYALQFFGAGGGVIAQVLNIVMWAIIAIIVIYICFALIQCLLGWSGGMPRLR